MSELRRQQSRVWWSSFHADDLLGSPLPRAGPSGTPDAPRPQAGPQTPSPDNAASPASPLDQGRDCSSSPSTSHKSQDSGFSDSEGFSLANRVNASPLSSSPEVPEAAAEAPLLSDSSHLQLCLSGACSGSVTPSHGPASFGGHATPRELRVRPANRLSQDDSCLPPAPPMASPSAAPLFRRQKSAEEDRTQRRAQREQRALSQSQRALGAQRADCTGCNGAATDVTPLNQTYPLPGPPATGHRAPRSFIKNKKPSPSRRAVQKYTSRACLEEDSTRSSSSGSQHATVLERLVKDVDSEHRTLPEGEEAVSPYEGLDNLGDLGALSLPGGLSPEQEDVIGDPYLDLTAGPGLPAHTSTPKATPGLHSRDQLSSATTATTVTSATVISAVPATPLSATPNRRPLGLSVRRLHDKKAARPVNLLSDFNRSPEEPSHSPCTPARLSGPVEAWLGQLRLWCEPECSVALQSKALLGADPRAHQQLRRLHLASPQGLSQLQARAQALSNHYTRLCGMVQRGEMESARPLAHNLVQLARDFLVDYESGGVPADRAAKLRATCQRLSQDAAKESPQPADLAASLAALRAALTRVVDAILEKHVQELVLILESGSSPLAVRGAVSGLCALGRQGPALADLVVRCGGVRSLLQIVLDARTSPTRRAALRALAAVCCTSQAIRSFEQAGGVEVVAELLSESGRCEEELAEAAAVLAQITAPWVPDNTRVEGLAKHLDPVVRALTRLVQKASSSEVLLLGTAALAHVSYVESGAVWPLLTFGAAGAVLRAVRSQGPRCSVFLQEQAATLVANMAAVPEARAELAAERAVVALLCFLQLRPSPLQRSADQAAAQRAQHKAAIALSRLASDPEVARQVVSLEGVSRLVRLCREERERNHSDGVLVACLAALRKIDANCGTITIGEKDRRELLEPRLLDSFMMFSTRQESYV